MHCVLTYICIYLVFGHLLSEVVVEFLPRLAVTAGPDTPHQGEEEPGVYQVTQSLQLLTCNALSLCKSNNAYIMQPFCSFSMCMHAYVYYSSSSIHSFSKYT